MPAGIKVYAWCHLLVFFGHEARQLDIAATGGMMSRDAPPQPEP